MVNYIRLQKVIANSKAHKISYITSNNRFDFPVVYLIYTPNSDSKPVYIGETNSFYSRMQEHLMGIGLYNIHNKIKRRSKLPQKIESYMVRYIRIDDTRERRFSECVLLGVYEPQLNFVR